MNEPWIRARSFSDLVVSFRYRLLEVYCLFIEKYSKLADIFKNLFEVLYTVIQKQFHSIENDSIEKKKKTTYKSFTDWT